MTMFEMVEFIVQWLAAPTAAFVWALDEKIGKHDTFTAVLEAQIASDKLAHDPEMKKSKKRCDPQRISWTALSWH